MARLVLSNKWLFASGQAAAAEAVDTAAEAAAEAEAAAGSQDHGGATGAFTCRHRGGRRSGSRGASGAVAPAMWAWTPSKHGCRD